MIVKKSKYVSVFKDCINWLVNETVKVTNTVTKAEKMLDKKWEAYESNKIHLEEVNLRIAVGSSCSTTSDESGKWCTAKSVLLNRAGLKAFTCYGSQFICDQSIDLMVQFMYGMFIHSGTDATIVSPVFFDKSFDNPDKFIDIAAKMGYERWEQVCHSKNCIVPINHDDHWVLAVICGVGDVRLDGSGAGAAAARGEATHESMTRRAAITVYIFDSKPGNALFMKKTKKGILKFITLLVEENSHNTNRRNSKSGACLEDRVSNVTRMIAVKVPDQGVALNCGFRAVWHAVLCGMSGYCMQNDKHQLHEISWFTNSFRQAMSTYPFGTFMKDIRQKMEVVQKLCERGLHHYHVDMVRDTNEPPMLKQCAGPVTLQDMMSNTDVKQYVCTFVKMWGTWSDRVHKSKSAQITKELQKLLESDEYHVAIGVLEGKHLCCILLETCEMFASKMNCE